jgi:coenzyme F420-reducing hydrogenase delta subunit
MTESEFVPEITAFCCHYCAYTAGDLAGYLHVNYPATVKTVKFPCTGKVDIQYILNAFEHGADGVYIMACLEGNCHHIHGNLRARRRVEYTKKLLDQIGVGGDRLEIFNTSGYDGMKWARIAGEMTERIKKLGPNPLKRRAARPADGE